MNVTLTLPACDARWGLQMAVWMSAHGTTERARASSVRLANRLREGLEPEYARKRQLKRQQKQRWIATHREQYLAKCREYARGKQARRRALKEGRAGVAA